MSDKELARQFCKEVGLLADKYGIDVFVVTNGASLTSSKGNDCILFHRKVQEAWERERGIDPKLDWSN